MQSERRNVRVPTEFECSEVREIRTGELIHYRIDEPALYPICLICGTSNPSAWTDDSDLWNRSTSRCY